MFERGDKVKCVDPSGRKRLESGQEYVIAVCGKYFCRLVGQLNRQYSVRRFKK